MEDSYESLARAIVVLAAKDYTSALKMLKKSPTNPFVKDRIRECESFFRSQWYGVLTDVDGEFLMRRIREEVYDK